MDTIVSTETSHGAVEALQDDNRAATVPEPVTDRQRVYRALRAAGYSQERAAKLAGYASRTSAAHNDRAMRRSLLAPLAHLAKRTVAGVMRDKQAKAADRLAAAKLVLDRVDPAEQRVTQQSLTVDVQLSPAERAKYLKLLGFTEEDTPDKSDYVNNDGESDPSVVSVQ